MTRIKLCGMMREQDIQTANQIRPYYCGFVFAPESPRYVTPATASMLIRGLSRGITPVGVFRNNKPEYIAECCRISGVKTVQLHGDYGDADVVSIKELTGLPVIRAFSVSSRDEAEKAAESSADFLMFDSGLGGTGKTFDISVLSGIGRDFFLAGGLDAENVAQTIKDIMPFAVDVSSGIETGGLKDPVRMKAFADAVRGADYEMEEYM